VNGRDTHQLESTSPTPAQLAPTSALAIATEPPGATVWIDGVEKGHAPINVSLPVGAEVSVRAELAGHVTTSRTVRVAEDPVAIRVELPPVERAATESMTPAERPHDGSGAPAADSARSRTGRATVRSPRRREEPSASTAGQGASRENTPSTSQPKAPAYNPDDLPD
jgi:hypothetical protein